MKFPLQALCDWYDKTARPLPWRAGKPDAYAILVSEVMSQQSTMATVLPYFRRWLDRFPRVDVLAAASDIEVVAHWAGLGYYSRARNLLKTAQALVAQGAPERWPQGVAAWQALPGIGPYTAAAVNSIAFDEPVIPLDGNVLRVASRLFTVADPLNRSADRLAVETHLALAANDIPKGSRGKVAQAMMELGSLVCRPQVTQTLCEVCPLKGFCQARQMNAVAEYPRPKVRAEAIARVQLAVVYRNPQGEFLLRQIPVGQRLEGQWELPLMEWDETEAAKIEVAKISGAFEVWGPVRHSITKYRYEVYGVSAGDWADGVPDGHRFSQGKDLTLTTLTRKVLEKNPFFS